MRSNIVQDMQSSDWASRRCVGSAMRQANNKYPSNVDVAVWNIEIDTTVIFIENVSRKMNVLGEEVRYATVLRGLVKRQNN